MTSIPLAPTSVILAGLQSRQRRQAALAGGSLSNGAIIAGADKTFKIQGPSTVELTSEGSSPRATPTHLDLLDHLQELQDVKAADALLENTFKESDMEELSQHYIDKLLDDQSLFGRMLNYTLNNHSPRSSATLVEDLDSNEQILKLSELKENAEAKQVHVLTLTRPTEIYEQRKQALDAMGQVAKLAQHLGQHSMYRDMVTEIYGFLKETEAKTKVLTMKKAPDSVQV